MAITISDQFRAMVDAPLDERLMVANRGDLDTKFKKEPFAFNPKGFISNFMYKWRMSTGEHGSYEQTFRPFFWPTLKKCTK